MFYLDFYLVHLVFGFPHKMLQMLFHSIIIIVEEHVESVWSLGKFDAHKFLLEYQISTYVNFALSYIYYDINKDWAQFQNQTTLHFIKWYLYLKNKYVFFFHP